MSAYEVDRAAMLRAYWERTLAEAGSVSKAAKVKGVHRTHLHKMLRSLGLRSPQPHNVGPGNWGDL